MRNSWSLAVSRGRAAILFQACLLLCFECVFAEPDPTTEIKTPVFKKHVIDAVFPGIAVSAVDVDGDGLKDVVAAGGPSGSVSKWSNQVNWYKAPKWERQSVCALRVGETREEKVVILHIRTVNFSAPAGKVAATGPAEIAVADGLQGKIWWYRYDRTAKSWSGSLIVEGVQGVHGIDVGDVDNDGYADILVPSPRGTPKRSIIWARNPGKAIKKNQIWPRYPLSKTPVIPSHGHYVRLIDINGDGRRDALHAAQNFLGLWSQGDNPQAPWNLRKLTGPFKRATNPAAADFNGDGRIDVVMSEGHGAGVWWFPAPTFRATAIDTTLQSTHCLTLGDYNGDGRVDIATCGYESKVVACFLNSGGTFERLDIDTDQCAYDAVSTDLDNDGDIDILLAGQGSHNVVWYENIGTTGR